jgi:putative pyruvate formate lyase activating enzyme
MTANIGNKCKSDPKEHKIRLEQAKRALNKCHLCGNNCGIDRTEKSGPCGIGANVYVASYGPHHGEESVLSGMKGSGTIFFSGCNLHCQYCQNHDISQHVVGVKANPEDLAQIMMSLQKKGCHNINLVSPTHVAAHIVPALIKARAVGLRIPIVYNTGGYDSPQALALMDGFIDIYMPDMKYSDWEMGHVLSLVPDYPQVNRNAVKEMHRQVGDLVIDNEGIAQRGLLVRHLVLPGNCAGTSEMCRFLVNEISHHTYVNVMRQYYPAYKVWGCSNEKHPMDRRITVEEYYDALASARNAGLYRFAV